MRISLHRIPWGKAGILATVGKMRELSLAACGDPEVIEWAAGIAGGGCCARVVVDRLRVWLLRHTRFEPDPPGLEIVREPLYMLRRVGAQGYAEGDCDDVATLGAAIGMVNYLPARFRLLFFDETCDTGHVYVELWTGSDWAPLDTTAPAEFPPGLEVWSEDTVEV